MPIWDWMIYALFSTGVIFYNVKNKKSKPIFRSFIVIYFVFVLLLTLITRTQKAHITAEWIPFWSWYEVIAHHNKIYFEEILLNIMMLMPLGVMLKLYNQKFMVK